jgi:hypothetical protein
MINYDDITVCMIHFNRPDILARTLPTFKNFKNTFVWDNNSEERNKVFLKAYSKKNPNVRPIFHEKNASWSYPLNQMTIQSSTDWVLHTADDVTIGKHFIEDLNKLLERNPNLEQIYLYSFDAMLFHKKTFAKLGWWEERQGTVQPSAEDDDWYLRLVEYLGYSPYVYPGDHIHGHEREKRLRYASTTELMERKDSIAYFSNCRWGISTLNFDVQEITRDKTYMNEHTRNYGEPGLVFHYKKWKHVNEGAGLLNKDGTFWQRQLPDVDFYPDVTKEWKEKYL